MKFLSPRAHAIIGLIVGLALLVAPNLFGFSDVGGAAVSVPRIIGVLIILNELMTNNGLSPFGFIPLRAHLISDFLVGLVLAASPWLFGFADEEPNAWLPHLIVGLLVMGYPLVTRTTPDTNTSELRV